MHSRKVLNISFAVTVAAAVAGGASAATTWYVDDATCPGTGSGTQADPFCSIGVALFVSEDGDEILVSPGTYQEAINLLGKAVWLHSTGGPGVTTIDGTGSLHVVEAVTGEGPDTILEGFTIRNGHAQGGEGNGGGMFTSASPTVVNCVFTANQALWGGGLYILNSSPEIRGCTFSGNTASSMGGGMTINAGAALVTNCQFQGNTGSGGGGGLYVTGAAAPSIQGSSFTSNHAPKGGGMYNGGSSNPTVIGCTFVSNTADSGTERWGGGVINDHGSASFTGCTFQSNTAFRGAGMFNLTCSPALTDCVFRSNSATDRGGGMYNTGDAPGGSGQSNPVLTGCEFRTNTAPWGAGMANDARELAGQFGPGSDPVLTGCLFFDNSQTGTGRGAGMWNNRSSNAQLSGCSFVSNIAEWGGAMFNDYGSPPMLDACVFIGNWAGYGGAIHSRVNSGGQVTNCQFSSNIANVDGAGVYDWGSSSHLTNCSFQDNHAAAGGGGISADLGGLTEALPVPSGCTFTGNVANGVGGAARLINADAVVTDCVFTDNHAWDHGGAIYAAATSTVDVSGSTFTHNWATDHGAAIYAHQSAVTFTTSTFEYNTATQAGGAIGIWAGSTGSITDCTFTGNFAHTHGGAMNIEQSTVTVTGCAFTQNLANSHGGAIHSFANNSTLVDCQFVENWAGTNGGGLSDQQSMRVVNCAFEGNEAWERGGAVYSYGGAGTTLVNLLAADNIARWGGGVFSAGAASLVNVTLAGNVGWEAGNGMYNQGNPTIRNSVLWDADFGYEIYAPSGTTTVTYSDVRGGWAGAGNIGTDPLCMNTGGSDYRLAAGSPCIDSANNGAVPADTFDLDGDGNIVEPTPIDLYGSPRFADDPYTADTGVGDAPIVDMGAYEFQLSSCPWDLNGDTVVNTVDFLSLLQQWGTDPGGPPDFNGDTVVNTIDFLELLQYWGPCP